MRQELRERLRRDRSVRDEHDAESRRVQERRTVHDVLVADERLVVGKGDAEIAARLMPQIVRECSEARGRDILRRGGVVCHRNAGVLTEGTREIAAEAADGEDEALGVKVVERLLLDRVERECGQPPIVHRTNRTVDVCARTAESRLSRAQTADMGAEGAGDTPLGIPVWMRCVRVCRSMYVRLGAHLSGAARR